MFFKIKKFFQGPVDAVTGRSRYSLSEQGLLRESLYPVALTVLVVPLDGFDQAPVQVRVLDCDTGMFIMYFKSFKIIFKYFRITFLLFFNQNYKF
jgi:hypothetical protein